MKQHFLSVLAIFKNETHILDEWILHYLKEGCDHFYLIDNGSEDNPKRILRKYADKISYFRSEARHCQVELYNRLRAKIVEESRWVAVVDLDEFLFSKKKDSTLKSYLESESESVGQVICPWTMFGSSGLIKQPIDGVVRNFTSTWNMSNVSRIEVKSIVRTRDLEKFSIHIHTIRRTSRSITSAGEVIPDPTPWLPGKEAENPKAELQLNHYCIQSLDYFKSVKATRGAADVAAHEKVRDMTYFQKYDRNQKHDHALLNK